MENYLSQVARVTKPNGKCLITYFLLNQESPKLIQDKKAGLDFKFASPDDFMSTSQSEPESGLAYPEDSVRTLFSKYNLRIKEPTHYGPWAGRSSFLSFQDIIIAEKQ